MALAIAEGQLSLSFLPLERRKVRSDTGIEKTFQDHVALDDLLFDRRALPLLARWAAGESSTQKICEAGIRWLPSHFPGSNGCSSESGE